MPRPLLVLAVALVGCSSEPQRDAAKTAPAPAPSAAAPPKPTPSPQPSTDAQAKPRPGALKTFGDWTVGCDNTLRCELRSLGSEAFDAGSATVSISRDAGPEGRIGFDASTQERDRLSAEVEGAAARTSTALVAAMANGHRMIAHAAGKALTISLKGAAAALRYVDAVQGRAGTVTALVAKGHGPAATVPAALAAPVIAAVAPSGEPTRATAAQLAAMRKGAGCDGSAPGDAPEYHALGGGRTLVLLPCSSGAYNLLQTLFVLDGTGFEPAKADAPVGFAETGAEGPTIPTVVNGSWSDGVLTSYAKGRGLGDCGVSQEFVWDGTRLRLSRQREMGECRGNVDYITTWRADVRRR